MDIVLAEINKSFGNVKVLDNLNLLFPAGRASCITGPSGCGKTTVLNIVAGVQAPDSGSVLGAEGIKKAYVFQEPRLLPWKTVLQNVEFVLPEKWNPKRKKERAMECLGTVELEQDAFKLPPELSRGMAQRCSLARALAADAPIVLLDEPFSGLDAALKERIARRLQLIWSERNTTVVMASHSEDEAALFSAGVFAIATSL